MKILLIKTFPLSLYDWNNIGIIDRELELFKYLSNKNNLDYTLGTYGNISDLKFSDKCKPIKILPFFKNNQKINNVFFKYLYSFFVPFLLSRQIKKFKIIQSNQFWGSWILIIIKFFYKKKIILRQGYDFYDFFTKKYTNFFLKFIIKTYSKLIYCYSDIIIVTTHLTAKNIQEKFKINKNKIYVIPNFIDTNIFNPIKFAKKKNRILCVGRLSTQKNYNFLFESIKNTNFEVDIIGHGNQSAYNLIIKNNNIKVNFLGNVPNYELPKIYNSYKLFVLCSLYEGHPKVLLEALACGMQCIATKVPGIKEMHNEKNFDMIELDTSALREKINIILNNESKINIDGVNFISENYSIQKISKKFMKIYEKLQ